MSVQAASPGIFGFSKWTVIGAGCAAFVGYCFYFDYKRRHAPDYKRRVWEKRQKKLTGDTGRESGGKPRNMPRPDDPTGMQAFFLQEVQLGEELLSQGQIEKGSEHVANAIVLCGQSEQLLSIFQQTLPPEQFNAVLEKLPGTRERLSHLLGLGDEPSGPVIEEITGEIEHAQPEFVDDDLE